MKISRNSAKICRIPEIHFANLVDLEKSEKMSIWTQKSASIQPRTSCRKFDVGPPAATGLFVFRRLCGFTSIPENELQNEKLGPHASCHVLKRLRSKSRDSLLRTFRENEGQSELHCGILRQSQVMPMRYRSS